MTEVERDLEWASQHWNQRDQTTAGQRNYCLVINEEDPDVYWFTCRIAVEAQILREIRRNNSVRMVIDVQAKRLLDWDIKVTLGRE